MRHLRDILLVAVVAGLAAGCDAPGEIPRPAPAGETLILDSLPVETGFEAVDHEAISLDGQWSFTRDPEEGGDAAGFFEPTFDRGEWSSQRVPGTFNRTPAGELDEYAGVAWLARTFSLGALDPTTEAVRLRFGACFLRCRYYLNGELLGESTRPYLPIQLDATRAAREGENLLVVRVDNRITPETVPVDTTFNPGRHGWWPDGGLTRHVEVVVTPRRWLYELSALPRGDGASGEVTLRLGFWNADDEAREVESVSLVLESPSGEVERRFAAERLSLPPGASLVEVEHAVPEPARWSREHPDHLYRARLSLVADGVTTSWEVRFGFRSVAVDDGLVALNGERGVLYGISRHEDAPGTGAAQSDEHLDEDLALLRELGVNHIRPGHYPADERFLRRLRDAGITIAEEIPIYQWSGAQMGDAALTDEAVRQLRAMIQRDRNNPAIVMWSLMNEVHSWDEGAHLFAQTLADTARKEAPDRLLTYALQIVPGILTGEEYVAPHVDVIGVNEYYGWYYGTFDDIAAGFGAYHDMFPDKAMLVSEFGAGGVPGHNEDAPLEPEPRDDHSYSEAWQAWFLAEHLERFGALDFPLAGVMPWAFADFHMQWDPSTGRPHPVHNVNLKGLVTLEREKKQAFDVVREVYWGRALDP